MNTGASVDHDGIIQDFVHISVRSTCCRKCTCWIKNWVGAGAIVLNNLNICNECMIGAGAVVINDINIKGTYIGAPAKLLVKE